MDPTLRGQRNDSWHIIHAFNEVDASEADIRLVLKGILQVTQNEAVKIETDNKTVLDFGSCLQLIDAVNANTEDFVEAVCGIAKKIIENFDFPEEMASETSSNLSRLLANITSIFRSFLDHSDAYVSRNYGKRSAELIAWKALQSKQYDTSFAYRFVSKLRNYIQHVDMPPLAISFASRAGKSEIDLRIDLSRERLLYEKHIWKSVAAELEQQPELISAISIIEEWDKCFSQLAIALINMRANIALDAAKRILDFRTQLGKPHGRLCLVFVPAGESPPDRLDMELKWLPEKTSERVLKLATDAPII